MYPLNLPSVKDMLQYEGSVVPKKQTASCVLAMEHPAVFLDSRCIDSGGLDEAAICVLAILAVGASYFWFGNNIEELRNAKPTKTSLSSEDMSLRNHKGDIACNI